VNGLPQLQLLLLHLLKKLASVETTAVDPRTSAGRGMVIVIMTMTAWVDLSARLRVVTVPPMTPLTAPMTVANFLKTPRQPLDPR